MIAGRFNESLENTYYVRDLSIESQGELGLVQKRSEDKGLLRIGRYGRYPLLSISAHDFYSVAEELLVENPYALTRHRLTLST